VVNVRSTVFSRRPFLSTTSEQTAASTGGDQYQYPFAKSPLSPRRQGRFPLECTPMPFSQESKRTRSVFHVLQRQVVSSFACARFRSLDRAHLRRKA
jgi:hypothetical protein